MGNRGSKGRPGCCGQFRNVAEVDEEDRSDCFQRCRGLEAVKWEADV
jgi:hypothetical protein